MISSKIANASTKKLMIVHIFISITLQLKSQGDSKYKIKILKLNNLNMSKVST